MMLFKRNFLWLLWCLAHTPPAPCKEKFRVSLLNKRRFHITASVSAPAMGPLQYFIWISLAVVTQCMLALWGILSRYLQTKPDAPAPALRLVLIVSLLAEATLLLFHALPTTAKKGYQRLRRSGSSKAAVEEESSSAHSQGLPPASKGADGPHSSRAGSESSLVAAVHDAVAAAGASELLATQQLEPSLPAWRPAELGAAAAAGSPAATANVPARFSGATAPVDSLQGARAVHMGRGAAAARSKTQQSPFDVEAGAPVPAVALVAAVTASGSPCGNQGLQAPLGSASTPAAAAAAAAAAADGPAVAAVVAVTSSEKMLPAEAAGAAAAPAGAAEGSCAELGAVASMAPLRPQHSSSSRLRALLQLRRRQKSTVRPEVAMRRGLSMRFEEIESTRPRLYRFLALATLTISFSATCGLQLCAPGFVDPSLVQLVGQFTAIGTALAQAVLLKHRLPWTIWPAALLMTGGAAMVIVPSFGQSEAGSLDSARGWLGFGLAVIALVTTVIYFITLQATRHLGFSSNNLQHTFLTFSIAVFLALSLPVDGTDWHAQFKNWTAGDWLILAFQSSIAYVGSAAVMQGCVWRLGAPLVSLLFGLRLVFTVALTRPVLGATVIRTGVQIAGVVITAGSVSAYVGLQWWQSCKADS